jgi:hypothetical protein
MIGGSGTRWTVDLVLSIILLTPELRQKIAIVSGDHYGDQFFLGLVAVLVTIAFVLSLAAGYAVAAAISSPRLERVVLVSACSLVLSLIPSLCYEQSITNATIARTIIIALGTLLGGYLRTPRRDESKAPPVHLDYENLHLHLEKSIDTSHKYARHMMTNLVNWFVFFVTVNYGSMGWFASAEKPNGSLVVTLATFFMFQNALGIVVCLRIRRYIAAAGREIIDHEQAFRGLLSK